VTQGPAAADPAAETASLDSLPLARRIAALLRERRGSDLVLLDVRKLVDYTDFFLLASGQSARQNQAMAEHVVKTLKGDRRYAISKSGIDTGSWICLDMGDVVVHVFDPETRARYDLELLWADAPRVPTEEPPPVPAAPAREEGAEEAPPAPAKRRRVVMRGAVEGADAANAPDSERPPEDEPEGGDVASPAARPAAKGRLVFPPAKKGPAPRKGAGKGPVPSKPRAKRGAGTRSSSGTPSPRSKSKSKPDPQRKPRR
jgi:ribosome-associated protein